MYEPRGDEGYNSLQEMPLPGSISGMKSELACSVTGRAGLDKRPLLPQKPLQRPDLNPQVSVNLAFLQREWGQSQGHRWVPSNRAGQAWPACNTPFPSRAKGCFPHTPTMRQCNKEAHQNGLREPKSRGEPESSLLGRGKASEKVLRVWGG